MFIESNNFRRPQVEVMIDYLDRMQIGYSALIAFGLQKDMDEELIIEDIESMVRKCCDDDNINVINNNSDDTEEYIKNTSELIFMQLKKRYNY
ncbi:MAG: hypothetical protein PUA84_06070 [Oscillospiraceae bacterium]|nr:hypothetical protein [Oscillospiraceae bacterium]